MVNQSANNPQSDQRYSQNINPQPQQYKVTSGFAIQDTKTGVITPASGGAGTTIKNVNTGVTYRYGGGSYNPQTQTTTYSNVNVPKAAPVNTQPIQNISQPQTVSQKTMQQAQASYKNATMLDIPIGRSAISAGTGKVTGDYNKGYAKEYNRIATTSERRQAGEFIGNKVSGTTDKYSFTPSGRGTIVSKVPITIGDVVLGKAAIIETSLKGEYKQSFDNAAKVLIVNAQSNLQEEQGRLQSEVNAGTISVSSANQILAARQDKLTRDITVQANQQAAQEFANNPNVKNLNYQYKNLADKYGLKKDIMGGISATALEQTKTEQNKESIKNAIASVAPPIAFSLALKEVQSSPLLLNVQDATKENVNLKDISMQDVMNTRKANQYLGMGYIAAGTMAGSTLVSLPSQIESARALGIAQKSKITMADLTKGKIEVIIPEFRTTGGEFGSMKGAIPYKQVSVPIKNPTNAITRMFKNQLAKKFENEPITFNLKGAGSISEISLPETNIPMSTQKAQLLKYGRQNPVTLADENILVVRNTVQGNKNKAFDIIMRGTKGGEFDLRTKPLLSTGASSLDKVGVQKSTSELLRAAKSNELKTFTQPIKNNLNPVEVFETERLKPISQFMSRGKAEVNVIEFPKKIIRNIESQSATIKTSSNIKGTKSVYDVLNYPEAPTISVLEKPTKITKSLTSEIEILDKNPVFDVLGQDTIIEKRKGLSILKGTATTSKIKQPDITFEKILGGGKRDLLFEPPKVPDIFPELSKPSTKPIVFKEPKPIDFKQPGYISGGGGTPMSQSMFANLEQGRFGNIFARGGFSAEELGINMKPISLKNMGIETGITERQIKTFINPVNVGVNVKGIQMNDLMMAKPDIKNLKLFASPNLAFADVGLIAGTSNVAINKAIVTPKVIAMQELITPQINIPKLRNQLRNPQIKINELIEPVIDIPGIPFGFGGNYPGASGSRAKPSKLMPKRKKTRYTASLGAAAFNIVQDFTPLEYKKLQSMEFSGFENRPIPNIITGKKQKPNNLQKGIANFVKQSGKNKAIDFDSLF